MKTRNILKYMLTMVLVCMGAMPLMAQKNIDKLVKELENRDDVSINSVTKRDPKTRKISRVVKTFSLKVDNKIVKELIDAFEKDEEYTITAIKDMPRGRKAATSVNFTFIFQKFSRKAHRAVTDSRTELNTFLSENLSGIKITQIFNREQQKLEDFLEAVALTLLQVVFHTTGLVHHHGHKAAVLPLPKGDGLAEHAGKHGLYPLLYLLVVPQHCQHLVFWDAVGTQEGNVQIVVAELGGNLVGQKCLPGAVGPHDEVHLRPVALLEGRLSPQEGQPHPCFNVDHETIVPHFWPKTKGRGEKDGWGAGG